MNNIIFISYISIFLLLFVGLFNNINHNFKQHKKFNKWQKAVGFFVFGGVLFLWPITLLITLMYGLYELIVKKIIKD